MLSLQFMPLRCPACQHMSPASSPQVGERLVLAALSRLAAPPLPVDVSCLWQPTQAARLGLANHSRHSELSVSPSAELFLHLSASIVQADNPTSLPTCRAILRAARIIFPPVRFLPSERPQAARSPNRPRNRDSVASPPATPVSHFVRRAASIGLQINHSTLRHAHVASQRSVTCNLLAPTSIITGGTAYPRHCSLRHNTH